MAEVFDGSYFDGKTAGAAPVRVTIGARALTIEPLDDRIADRIICVFIDIEIIDTIADNVRLTSRTAPDARLVLPRAAKSALLTSAPDIFSGARGRRRMAALIGALIAGAGVVTAALFIGVPAASGPMARSTPKDIEIQIGENLAAQLQVILRPCGGEEELELIRSAIDDMALTGEVGFPLTFNIVRTDVPNALALPGGQVMATTGLLTALEKDQEAFFAVIAHELGHVKNRDGMQAVYRNAGLGALLEIITGGSGHAQQAVLLGGQLNQLRHTRKQEAAADDTAIEIMGAANPNPATLARAFEGIVGYAGEIGLTEGKDDREARNEKTRRKISSWLSSHPDTDDRIANANNNAREGGSLPVDAKSWDRIVEACAIKHHVEPPESGDDAEADDDTASD